MQLQQSTFQISRSILSSIPKPALILSSLILLIIIITNTFLMISSKPNLILDNCIQKYYNMTHVNISQYLIEQTNQNKTSSIQDIEQIVKYLNQTTVVIVDIDKNMVAGQECRIQLGYNMSRKFQKKIGDQQVQQLDVENTKIAWMMSNYALFYVNYTDDQYMKKHPVHYNRITLPTIYNGYRYLGMDVFANSVEDFLYAASQGFLKFQIRLRQRWLKEFLRLANYTKQQQQNEKKKMEENDKNKNKTPAVQQKQNTINKNQLQNSFSDTPTQQQQSPLQKAKALFQQVLIQTTNSTNSEVNETIASGTQNQTINRLDLLKMQLMSMNTYFSPDRIKTSFNKHRILYRMQQNQSWYSVYLSSSLPDTQTIIIWKLIGKALYAFLTFCLIISGGYFVAICVRYAYIVSMTILNLIGGKRLAKYAGWMSRYTDIYNKNPQQQQRKLQNLKLKIQIVLSFIGMYVLYSIMAYLLSQIIAGILTSVETISSHPMYYKNLLTTFYIIQITHYIFFRTRITLDYFAKFSVVITLTSMMFTAYNPFYMTSYILNNHLIITLFLIFCFLFLQKLICQEQLQTGHRPNIDKPRMLFYLGYDLDWHKGLPPVWTMFQPWFDLSFASQHEKSYIDQNYQLLYGKLLGVNQPQQLPDEEDQNQQASSFKHIQMSEISD